MSEVAILVLNWRSYDRTRACLDAVSALEGPPQPRVYVVDNESNPAQLAALTEDHPEIVPLPLERNEGFSGGINHGIRRALADGAEHILLLNNDALITPPCLRQLQAIFTNRHLKAGIVAPSLRTLPPEERIAMVGLDVNRWSGRVTLRHHGSPPELLYPYPHQADAVSGACMLVSRELLEEIGLLDDDYFFYFEDVDLCLRARAAGYNVYVVPTAVTYHEGGATMGDAPERAYYGVRNQLRVISERGLEVSPPVAAGRSAYIMGLHLAQILRERRGSVAAGLKAWARGIADHRSQRYGPLSP